MLKPVILAPWFARFAVTLIQAGATTISVFVLCVPPH